MPDCYQDTPVFYSVNGRNLNVVKMLLSHSMDSVHQLDGSGQNVHSWAVVSGEIEFVEYHLGMDNFQINDADHSGRIALSWAAGNGHPEVTMLLRRSMRVDVFRVDQDSRNAISWACSGGNSESVELSHQT